MRAGAHPSPQTQWLTRANDTAHTTSGKPDRLHQAFHQLLYHWLGWLFLSPGPMGRTQGTEAGGHTGDVSTLVLLPQVLDVCAGKCLVVAAGGIYDGRGVPCARGWGLLPAVEGACVRVSMAAVG